MLSPECLALLVHSLSLEAVKLEAVKLEAIKRVARLTACLRLKFYGQESLFCSNLSTLLPDSPLNKWQTMLISLVWPISRRIQLVNMYFIDCKQKTPLAIKQSGVVKMQYCLL